MGYDKVVDSTQLDADLLSVANAIRTKGGTSASLAFPAEFVSAIESIRGGLNYHLETVECTAYNNGPYVTRQFDDFILLAEFNTKPTEMPTNTETYLICYIYINDNFVATSKYAVRQNGTTNLSLVGVAINPNQLTVSETSLRISGYNSGNNAVGVWNVLQIELPANHPFYSFL